MAGPVIAWDYQFAPNAQKARNLLFACGIPFRNCEQPFVMPRPILTGLGITYRRIPVLSIGKDVYCDNRCFADAVQTIFPDKALVTSPADHAYESFGYRSFWICLPLVPSDFITPQLAKDRATLFSVFSRPDFATLRSNALGQFKSLLDMVENDFLSSGGPWINGAKCGMADIHAMWMIKWALQTMNVAAEPGISREDFPKVYKWIEGLPTHADTTVPQISSEEATKIILSSEYAAKDIGVDPNDPLGISAGTRVSVEADDAESGTDLQYGQLVGLNHRETVVELDNGLRVHFPRIGYLVRKA